MDDNSINNKVDKTENRAIIAKKIIWTIFLSLIFTILSSVLIWLESPAELRDMRFGRPFPFIYQNYNGVIREEFFPRPAHPQFSAESCTTEISVVNFLLSFAVYLIITGIIIFGLHFLRIYLKKRKH